MSGPEALPYGNCQRCGHRVVWFIVDGRHLPPHDYVGKAMTVDPQTGQALPESPVFTRHRCLEADVARQSAWVEQRRAAEDERERYRFTREEERKAQWTAAIVVECPTCGAPEGEACFNMSPKSVGQPTRYPHPARAVLAAELARHG